jgi:hypothetical protein
MNCVMEIAESEAATGTAPTDARIDELIAYCDASNPTTTTTTKAPPTVLPRRPDPGDYDCDSFEWQEEAQEFYESDDGDPYHLDGDNDGYACEWLPSSEDEYGVSWGEDPPDVHRDEAVDEDEPVEDN